MARNVQVSMTAYDDDDREIWVTATVLPEVSAIHYGPNMRPPEPAETEDLEAVWEDTGRLLTDAELSKWVDLDRLVELAYEQMDDYDDGGREDD